MQICTRRVDKMLSTSPLDFCSATHQQALLEVLCSVEACFQHMVRTRDAGLQQAALQVADCCTACLQKQAEAAALGDSRASLMLSATSQAAVLLLQQAIEASGRSAMSELLVRVLRGHRGSSRGAFADLNALLLMLECHSLPARRTMQQHCATVFTSLLATVHAALLPSCAPPPACRTAPEQPRTEEEAQEEAEAPAQQAAGDDDVPRGGQEGDRRPTGVQEDGSAHAAVLAMEQVLALRCMESLVGQKADFPHLSHPLRQVPACVCAAAASLQQRAATATAAQRRGELVEGLLCLGACCALLTALLRHRPEAASALAVCLPGLSACWIDTLVASSRASLPHTLRCALPVRAAVPLLRACVLVWCLCGGEPVAMPTRARPGQSGSPATCFCARYAGRRALQVEQRSSLRGSGCVGSVAGCSEL